MFRPGVKERVERDFHSGKFTGQPCVRCNGATNNNCGIGVVPVGGSDISAGERRGASHPVSEVPTGAIAS